MERSSSVNYPVKGNDTIRKYGLPPYRIALLHGGPGAAGQMKPVAEYLSGDFGILELLQTEKSIGGLLDELHRQLSRCADFPVVLAGHSWGAWLGFLFAARFPNLVKKLILISSGAFEGKYNRDLMRIRLERLNPSEKKEAGKLLSFINYDDSDRDSLRRFGELMSIADSFDYLPDTDNIHDLNVEIYRSVWPEASRLRDSGELIGCAGQIACPVVALHGDYDAHPVEGVAKPLAERLRDFTMIRLENCGHTPWKERYARDQIFRILKDCLD